MSKFVRKGLKLLEKCQECEKNDKIGQKILIIVKRWWKLLKMMIEIAGKQSNFYNDQKCKKEQPTLFRKLSNLWEKGQNLSDYYQNWYKMINFFRKQ